MTCSRCQKIPGLPEVKDHCRRDPQWPPNARRIFLIFVSCDDVRRGVFYIGSVARTLFPIMELTPQDTRYSKALTGRRYFEFMGKLLT